ncbi:serine/threonine protein phosphatase [Terrimonas sp. NA20]|uniref:Serine/threonine protein phosphatase n=1 Tax=Terrimonas ginsenosidimutans TaxID=2908004 RepID=A0ABS9KTW3_9BACT|nr:metallophosphoesterase family protein [Terrimonas ginsenosidimutans]MCG2615770.1 serine/threonine protein phosphatase [Terrimonas ginsenosidimutans]
MSRTIAIGDIHGGLKALQQVIDLVKPTDEDLLIFLGDYVDGWSQSAQVIDYLIALSKRQFCIFIKGNHDAWCEAWLSYERLDKEWLNNGSGQSTVDSYKDHTPEEKEQHAIFFNSMRSYYADEHNRLFIHAGFSSMHGPEKERYETTYFWDRTLWETALALDKELMPESKLYPRRLKLFKEIFIGHTPTTNYDVNTPMHYANVWNIDTGAAFTGAVTAIDADTKEYWQSDIVQKLYPSEKGRHK